MMVNKRESIEVAEAGLEDTLRNFRSSVHAWSEAEFVRPRTVLVADHRRTWRSATAWALGCVLAAGTLSAGIYEHHAHDQLARLTQRILAHRVAAQRTEALQAEQKQLAARQDAAQNQDTAEIATQAPTPAAGADEKLMAAVDQDVSQQVPSAMEPLAQLMDEGPNQ
jgi:hypothetical protein